MLMYSRQISNKFFGHLLKLLWLNLSFRIMSCFISDDHFSVVHLKFHFFRISCQILREFAPWMPPPGAASCPGNDIFLLLFWLFTYIFVRKLALWMSPRVDARGRCTVRTPSARH